VNIDETPEEAVFRAEVAKWIASNIPASLRDAEDSASNREIDRLLASAGYLGYTWPTEFGGQGGTPTMAAILDEERALAGIPASRSPSRFGIHLVGAALIRHGSEAQRQEFLPRILRVEHIWCQGFSEPEAGSDLANVRTRLDADGDHFVVNGSKLWTTQAHEADWCFALMRSDQSGPKHRSLSFAFIDMHQPGISVRPLAQMTGGAEFNEVFFDNARVEPGHIIGELGEGWIVTRTVLGAERTYAQVSRYRQYMAELDRIAGLLADSQHPSRRSWLIEFGKVNADVSGIRDLSYKITSLATAGEDSGSLPSITKLWWSTTHQRLVELGYTVAVALGRDVDYWFPLWLRARAETIYAGASQVQRNIIAEQSLGLPR
jgi:alkylation response protein AidB-like acyl-CoA dehydrogenase